MSEAEDRHLARRVAARTQIKDIRLLKSSFELESIPAGGQLRFGIDFKSSEVDWEPGEDQFMVQCHYELALSERVFVDDSATGEPEETEPIAIANIEFALAGLFELEMQSDDAPPTDAEVKAYAATTGAFALYPFAREYVYDVTGRLRLPALTLPVRLLPLAESENV
jgi:hypothetical protein